MFKLSSDAKQQLLVTLLLFFVCFLAYSNSFSNPFIMDDHNLIEKNYAIKDVGFLQVGKGSALYHAPNKYFRPITHLFDLIPYLIFGRDPFGYHIFNFLLFFLCGISIFETIYHFFKDRPLALLTSVLFCAHPINGFLVNYQTMSGYSVMIITMNYAFILLSKSKEKSALLYISGLLLFIISLLAHETALAFLFYYGALLYFARNKQIKEILKALLPLITIVIAYFIVRGFHTSNLSSIFDTIAQYNLNLFQLTATFYNLILHYLKNLLLLENIVLMWSSPIIKNNLMLWNGLLLSGLVICICLLIHWKKDEKSLGLSWFILGLIPITLACFSRPNVGIIIQPHWLFFPTIGFLLIVSSLIIQVSTKFKPTTLIIITLIPLYVLSSRAYNTLWQTEKRYITYMLSLSPNIEWAKWWLAFVYSKEGQYTLSNKMYKKNLMGNFGDWRTHINIGFNYHHLNDKNNAIENFQKAIEINPNAADAYNNIGVIFFQKKDYKTAKIYFTKAVKLDYYLVDAKRHLANIYIIEDNLEVAENLYKEILKIEPNDKQAQQALDWIKQQGDS